MNEIINYSNIIDYYKINKWLTVIQEININNINDDYEWNNGLIVI